MKRKIELELLNTNVYLAIIKTLPNNYLSDTTFEVLISDHKTALAQEVTKTELLAMAQSIKEFAEAKDEKTDIFMDCPKCKTRWQFTIKSCEHSSITFVCHQCNGHIILPEDVQLLDFKVVKIGGKIHGKNTV